MILQRLKVFLLLAVLASCSTQHKIDKAKDILRDNRQDAAAFCMTEFPDSNIIVVTVDSSGYNSQVGELQHYADSLLNESDARLRAINNLTAYIDGVEADGRYDAGVINELKGKLAAIKPVNVDRLRADIEKQIRSTIKPCKDSLIKIIPTKEIEYLKEGIKKEKARGDKYESKNDHKGKWLWWLIIYGTGMTVFAFRKTIIKLLV